MKRPRQPSAAELELAVLRWNTAHAIGTPVTYRRDDGGKVNGATRSPASILSGHTAVIWVTGIAGCVALERVEVQA